MADKYGRGSRRWRKLRAAILASHPPCALCGKAGADSIDHIVEVDAGGPMWEPSNLRPAHLGCNSSRGATYGNRKRATQAVTPSRRWVGG